MNSHLGLSGEYQLVITSPDGTVRKSEWIKNLILDQGLNRIGQSNSILGFCHIGTGTTVPDVTQTALSSFTASKAWTSVGASVVNSGSPTYASVHTMAYPFAQGAVVGNMTEIGVGWAATGAALFSRTLITAGGVPTTLTVLAIDQLTVYYRLTIKPDTSVSTGAITLGGNNYDYVSSMAYVNNAFASDTLFISYGITGISSAYSNGSWICYTAPASTVTLGAITTGLANETGYYNGNGAPAVYNGTYVNNSYYLDTVFPLPVGTGNHTGGLGGIRILLGWQTIMHAKYVFTPAIPKDATKTLSLTFRTSWGRAV